MPEHQFRNHWIWNTTLQCNYRTDWSNTSTKRHRSPRSYISKFYGRLHYSQFQAPLAAELTVYCCGTIPFHQSCGICATERTNYSSQVSDGLGFGTGGTSVPINVQNSSDSSCFNATKEASPSSFTFTILGDIAQCNSLRFSMDGPTQGSVMALLIAIIPCILKPSFF